MLAGRCADGVILLGGVATSLIQRSLDLVAEGARSVGRDPSEIEVTVATFACVTDDVASAAQVLKPVVLTIATGGGKGALAAVGVEVQPGFVPGSHGDDVYPDLLHAVDAQAAIDFAGQYVSDEAATRFAETFCLFGDTDSIRQRVDAVAATGVNRIYVQDTQSYGFPLPLMEQFRPVIEQERP
jgi:5,10-methylenetetrahydromethanopterin reductase